MSATLSLMKVAEISQIQLREYQSRIVAITYQHIRAGIKRVLIVAVMGAGKTIIASWMMRDAVKRGRRIVFLVSLNVLLDQTANTLRKLGVNCTVLQGDRPVDESAPVIVASLQTISARLRKGKSLGSLLGGIDLFFVDEAHVAAFHATYEIIEQFYPQSIFIGLSATPWRRSKKQWLGQKFAVLVEGPQPPEIVKMGGAVLCRGYTIGNVFDLEVLRVRNGDFVDAELASQACRPEALEHVVREWMRLCFDRPTLMIGATVKQADLTCKALLARGIKADLIVGSTSKEERQAIFERVTRGETQVICSVGCLTAGFDLPCISAILYVRATKSKALFFQSAGRGSRPYPGKTDYLLLDFGGNLKRFKSNPMGYQNYDISQPYQYEGEGLTKTCPECDAEISIFAQICPECGHEFTGEKPVEETEELVLAHLTEYVDRFTRDKIRNLRRWRKDTYLNDRTPDEPIAHFTAEYGHNPPDEWLIHACLTKRCSKKRKQAFIAYLERHSKATRWQNQWINHHLRLEFGTDNREVLDLFTQWWQVLGVPPSAGWEAIKRRYQGLVREFEHDPAEIDRINLALDDAREELTVAAIGGMR